jgi:hypothetical protein
LLNSKNLRHVAQYATIFDKENKAVISKGELIQRINNAFDKRMDSASEYDKVIFATSQKMAKQFMDNFLKNYEVA